MHANQWSQKQRQKLLHCPNNSIIQSNSSRNSINEHKLRLLGATSEAGAAYPSGAPECIPGF